MGCCNEPVTTLTSPPLDPSQHVNYARGMVLGVDDFQQEFAYHSERNQWLARDAIGYGTLSGLKLYGEDAGADGPRLHVTSGSALAMSGKLICVAADQCCVINKWLAKPDNAATVMRRLGVPTPSDGTTGTISLYLTLCYTDCQTAPVPVPGEPCRSEDELMAYSRIADDYCLELRADAPPQLEEDGLRDFVLWLRTNVKIVDVHVGPPNIEDEWRAALGQAIKPWTDALNVTSPPAPSAIVATLGDYLVDIPAPGLQIARDQTEHFMRFIFRFWVTELRPMWMAMRCHQAQCEDVDCLLLARITFNVVWAGGSPTGAWQITGGLGPANIDESTRPIITNRRLMQELLAILANSAGGGGGGGGGGGLPQDLSQAARPTFAGLTLTGPTRLPIVVTSTNLTLDESHHYVVCDGGLTVTLPKCVPGNKGLVYNVRSMGASSTLVPAAGDTIVGGASVPVSNPKILVSDGASAWYVF